MKLLRIIAAICFVTISLFSCKSNESTKQKGSDDYIPNENAKLSNTSDLEGAYFGVFADDNCSSINTLILIKPDNYFEKIEDFVDCDKEIKTTKGEFSFKKESTIITLDGEDYLIGKNKLELLNENIEAKESLPNKFTLLKTELELQPDDSEGYYLYVFKGDDNNDYNIIFNTNPKVPTAYIQSNSMKVLLQQTQAWVKGAEYESGEIKLIAKEDSATLIVNGEKIYLKK